MVYASMTCSMHTNMFNQFTDKLVSVANHLERKSAHCDDLMEVSQTLQDCCDNDCKCPQNACNTSGLLFSYAYHI